MPRREISLGTTWPDGFEHEAATVTEDGARRVARSHAEATWGAPATIGPILHVSGLDGRPFAYATPFALESDVFPAVGALLARIGALHREMGMEPEGRHWATPPLMQQVEDEFGRFGTVYVSAQRTRGPILMTSNVLPTFFFMADLASIAVSRAADAAESMEDTRLGRLMFANPHEELVECIVGDRTLLLDADSMEFEEADAFAEALHQPPAGAEEPDDTTDAAWAAALAGTPEATATPVGRAAVDTVVTIPHPMRMPPINWTYWCSPTAWTMAFCYWDNYRPGSGTHLGYGKVADFWFDHDPTMANVPNLIDEIIDKTKTPPSWAGDTFAMINAQGYSFSSSAIVCHAGNNWGWSDIKAEIDAGRPVLVGMMSKSGEDHNNHAMVAYGYRLSATGQRFLKLLNTWGTTWQQQSVELAVGIWQGLPLIKMGAERLQPGGGTGLDHLVLTQPGGGEKINRLFPYDIVWYVWGASITRTRLSESRDGGRTWHVIAADIPTTTGKNTYRWVPQHEAARSRVRIEGFTSSGSLVAGDGSRQNVVIRSHPLNSWSGWLGLGRPGIDISDMSVGRNSDGRLETVAVTVDGSLWHRYQAAPASQSWIGWDSMGRPPGETWLRAAELASNDDGRLEVIALGSDGGVWHRWQPQPSKGPWVGWASLGKPSGVTLRRLTLEMNKDGRLQILAIGDDDQVWTSAQSSPGKAPWSSWASLGGPGTGVTVLSLDAAANTDGRIEVVISGGVPSGSEFGLQKPRVWLAYQPTPNKAAPWSAWLDMGHPTGGAGQPVPTVSRNADGRLEMFVPGIGGELWHRWQPAPGSGPWSGWASRGSPRPGEWLMSPLAVGRGGDGRLEAFGLSIRSVSGGSLDLDCRHIWQTKPSNGWSKWGGLGSPLGRTVQSMRAVERQNGRLELFVLTSEDRALWHNVQK